MASKFATRLARVNDAIFLREMLYEAARPLNEKPPKEELLATPGVAAFIDGWGRQGDSGVVAEKSLEPVGPPWYPDLLPDDDPEGGFVGGETPELVVAVEAPSRGQGVGRKLIDALVERAREENYPSLGLTVAGRNVVAVSLFKARGFTPVRDRDGLLTMQVKLH